jgi:hypothetical protein
MFVVIMMTTLSDPITMAQALPADSSSLSSSSLITFPLVPYRELLRRRGLSSVLDETALYQGYGTHFIDFYCGTPSQRRTVTVDTGSGYIAFPCTGCQSCGTHVDPEFDPSSSTSFQKISCSSCQIGQCSTSAQECLFGAQYLEGDGWEAYEASDTCFAGDPSTSSSSLSFKVSFGCQVQVTGFFASQQEDGIMGMGNFNTAFWNQMYLSGKIQNPMFSVCYAPSLNLGASSNGAAAGVLVLGGADTRLHTSTMLYSSGATTQADPFFHVNLRNIYIQGAGSSSNVVSWGLTSAELNPANGTIVDSGTTDADFDSSWQSAFDQAWLQATGTAFSQTYTTSTDFSNMPTLLFQFEGDSTANAKLASSASSSSSVTLASSIDSQNPYDIIVAFPPSHYMQYDNNQQVYVPVITFGQSGTSIMGGNFIMEYDVLFDTANNRIGWAPSECSYSQLTGQSSGSTTTTGNSQPSPIINRTPTQAPGSVGGGGLFHFFSASSRTTLTFGSKCCVLLGVGIFTFFGLF